MLFAVDAKWMALAFIVFALGMPEAAKSAEPVTSKTYTYTAKVVEEHILYPKDSDWAIDEVLPDIKADIMRVYPVGRGSPPFQKAPWVFTSDGIAAVLLEVPRTQVPESLTLVGTWGAHNGVVRLHVAGAGRYGLTAAMDGLLRVTHDGYLLTGIFSAAVRGAHHVERVTLDLRTLPNPPVNAWAGVALELARQEKAIKRSIPGGERVLSEPAEWIGGVPVPTAFDATLKVKLDGVELPPMKGQLLLRRLEGSSSPKLYLLLTTSGPVVPGWSGWMTNRDSAAKSSSGTPVSEPPPEPGVAVTAKNGCIHVEIAPALVFRQVQWTARNPDQPEGTAFVRVDSGTIDLQIKDAGERFTGTINDAKGTVLAGTRPVSTFSAELSGDRQGGSRVKEEASFVGPRPFEGRWRDRAIGELNLHQQPEKVSGTFSDGGVIDEGVVEGPVLDFHWKKAKGGSGRGFVSAASSGVLVGMTWQGEDSLSPDAIVAVQAQPPTKPEVGADWERPPENDAQAQELKSLAYDLSHAGKHHEAAKRLMEVVDYYQNHRKSAENDPAAYENYLLAEALPLNNLMSDAYEAGDYQTLVKALTIAVDVHREMGQGPTRQRSFRTESGRYIAELGKAADTMDNLAAAFDRGLTSLLSFGIGISIEAAPESSGMKVTGVQPDMPASRAGVAVDDLLVAIDGVPVGGMNLEQASARLRGDAGSPVSIRVLRGRQPRQVDLVRVPLINVGPERRDELAKAMAGMRDLAVSVSKDYRAEANTVKQLSTVTTDVPAAFEKLIALVTLRQASFEGPRHATIALAQRCLAASPAALELFKRFVELQSGQIKEDGTLNEDYDGRMLTLDREEDEFELSRDVPDLDKGLLRLSIIMVGEFDASALAARGRLRNVKHAAEFSSHAPPPDQTYTKTLASLDKSLENARSWLITDSAKIEATDFGQEFYAEYVRAFVDLKLPEQALQASEAARARAFADLLASSRTTSLLEGSSARGAAAQLSFAGGDLVSSSAAPPLSLQEIRDAAIANAGTIVEYWLSGDTVSIWVISPQGRIDLPQPASSPRIADKIDELKQLMEAGLGRQELKDQAATLLRELYAILIAPLDEQRLLPQDAEQVITVIPHGKLFYVPFAALLDKDGEYFIEKHTLAYETAISVLKYAQRDGSAVRTQQPRLLAFVSPSPLPDPEMRSLDLTTKEFPKIAALYGANWVQEIYAGKEATFARVRKRASDADVLYFATHGVVNDEHPSESFVALAKTSENDGRLRVSNISALRIRANLVVLAACKTGLGKVTGDGVNGLSRAFTLAGSPNLITALWSTQEDQMILLMGFFHEYWLQEKLSKARALRKAQIQRLGNYRTQPNLWAGVVLYGPNEKE